jgi:PAS domain S-box-containing protein
MSSEKKKSQPDSQDASSRAGSSDSKAEYETIVEQMELRERALAATEEGITIADARQPDFPIIYANPGFERLTGYSVAGILGQNCRFLQGPETDQSTVDKIRDALRLEKPVTVELLNYRMDGTTFWNRLSITPIVDHNQTVTHYIGVQSDITERVEAERALERAKNELQNINKRMKTDLDRAARVQHSLLPVRLPQHPAVQFAWNFVPSTELAGDTLNVFPVGPDRFALYVLDVSGHGLPAALLSVTLSRYLSPRQYKDPVQRDPVWSQPVDVIDRLNRQFPMDEDTNQYFTIVYGVLDVQERVFRYVSAGHPPPLQIRPDGTTLPGLTTGLPIGVFPEATFEEAVMNLDSRDRVILYTDGILEAENSQEEEFGQDRLVGTLQDHCQESVQTGLDFVVDEVRRWAGKHSLADDVSLLSFFIE